MGVSRANFIPQAALDGIAGAATRSAGIVRKASLRSQAGPCRSRTTCAALISADRCYLWGLRHYGRLFSYERIPDVDLADLVIDSGREAGAGYGGPAREACARPRYCNRLTHFAASAIAPLPSQSVLGPSEWGCSTRIIGAGSYFMPCFSSFTLRINTDEEPSL